MHIERVSIDILLTCVSLLLCTICLTCPSLKLIFVSDRGEFEERLQAIVEEVTNEKAPPTILFIDGE